MTDRFGDDIAKNQELIAQIMSGMPASARSRARRAGAQLTDAINKIARDNPKDPAVALGIAFGLHYHAKRVAEHMQDHADRVELNARLDESVIEMPH